MFDEIRLGDLHDQAVWRAADQNPLWNESLLRKELQQPDDSRR